MVNHHENESKKIKNVLKHKGRKPYIKPQLSKFGHIEKLTQGPTGKTFDGGATKWK
jgi:hypothetical protein